MLWGVTSLDRRIARLAIPALGSIAAEPLYNLADTAIVGHLGRVPLDSLAIAASALAIVAWVAIFLTTATTTPWPGAPAGTSGGPRAARRGRLRGRRRLGGHHGGAGGRGRALRGPVARRAWRGARGRGPVPADSGDRPAVPLLSYAGNGHMTGLENTRTPLRIALGANGLNVALEVLLVFGLHAGLSGSAWGTVAAQVAAAAWYAGVLAQGPAAAPRARPRRTARAAADGHRLSVRTIALGVVPLAATAVVARLGPVALGGQQVAYRLWYLLSLSLDALAVPAQVFVSAAVGAGDAEAARLIGRRTLILGLSAGTVLGVLTAVLALGAPDVFTADPAIRHAAVIAPALLRAHPAGGCARVRPRRPHPRHLRLYRHTPRDAPRHRRVRPGGRARAPLPLARPAGCVGRAGPVAGRPLRAPWPALGGRHPGGRFCPCSHCEAALGWPP